MKVLRWNNNCFQRYKGFGDKSQVHLQNQFAVAQGGGDLEPLPLPHPLNPNLLKVFKPFKARDKKVKKMLDM